MVCPWKAVCRIRAEMGVGKMRGEENRCRDKIHERKELHLFTTEKTYSPDFGIRL